MASSPPPPLLLLLAALLLLPSALSQPCNSQTFPQSNFTDCSDLPTLKAQLHWAYDPSAQPNPTLSVAFVAAPAKPDGWVGWALNPTGSGMVGAQALVAFKDANGSVVVKTYNITAYAPIAESPIAYEVVTKRGEYSAGVMRIFATLALPPGKAALNQVWQVGSSVKDGVPVRHDFSPENLGSKGVLRLGGEVAAAPPAGAPVEAPAAAPTVAPGRGNDTGGSWRIHGVGVYGGLVLLGVVLGF